MLNDYYYTYLRQRRASLFNRSNTERIGPLKNLSKNVDYMTLNILSTSAYYSTDLESGIGLGSRSRLMLNGLRKRYYICHSNTLQNMSNIDTVCY